MKKPNPTSPLVAISVLALPFISVPSCRHQDSISLRIDAGNPSRKISRYIYGSNENQWDSSGKYLTFGRQGGNRMTAYNWENNASNAGSDWHNQSDDYLGGGDIPGEVPRKAVADALSHGATFLVTIPMAGYVSADKSPAGDVNLTPNYLETRFKKSVAKKNASFAYPPDLTDGFVYQDEFVHWLEGKFPNRTSTSNIWYSLDNEPDLWSSTHSRIHPKKLTYAEIVQRTVDYSEAIKAVAPKTLIFGPASYGWNGYVSLQDAPDAQGRDFITFYLQSMKQAQDRSGKRLLDVLDLHWYPEARGGGKRIIENDGSPAVAKARMQATRSLWDPTYVEDSWIAQSIGHKPIDLIHREEEKIAANYPGTKLAFTEYEFGGGEDISGAIAEADALGIFGRMGVFAAAFWPTGHDAYVHAGMDCFRDYDGQGAAFGDLALKVSDSDPTDVSIYASKFSNDPNKIVCVIVNQYSTPQSASLAIDGSQAGSVRQFSLTGEAPKLHEGHFAEKSGNGFSLNLPPLSVNVLEIK